MYNGTEWCNTCTGAVKVRVPSGEWIQVDPMTTATKYFNGTEWVEMDCCYEITVDTPLDPPTFLGGNTERYEINFVPMNFMDEDVYVPTCEELKALGCPDPIALDDGYNTFREDRDVYLYELNENLIYNYVGQTEPNTLNTTQWEEGELGDVGIYYKGGLQKRDWNVGCWACAYPLWSTQPYESLGGDTISDRIPLTDGPMVWLDRIEDENEPLPTGEPGQLLSRWNGSEYILLAWDSVIEDWSINLYSALEDILSAQSATRSAWLLQMNSLTLATNPFVWANDYLPFHRFNAEKI